jgi:tRNA pseudouridine13 synthase
LANQFLTTFPRAYPETGGAGVIKQYPEDFIVEEVLSFTFAGEGEHIYLQVKKINQNTMWVVKNLARHFSVKEKDIGFAGLKDRYAVTTQWFSVLAQKATPDKIQSFTSDGIEILDVQRHTGKLRKGAIKYNLFNITVRELDTAESVIDQRLRLIASLGVPNYFDEQRFGKQRYNLIAASRYFKGEFRPKRSKQRIYLSAARSWLFNLILAERVSRDCWATGLDGDVFMLNGSKKFFHTENMDELLKQRLIEHDIHPTVALWGTGKLETSLVARDLEMSALDGWQSWCRQLETHGMKQQRRASRVVPGTLHYEYESNTRRMRLAFSLPSGSYATNLLREIVQFKQGAKLD